MQERMKSILVISALVVAVYGRPEPPSGYQYPSQPSSRYGVPSSNGDFGQGGFNQGEFRSIGGQPGIGGGLGNGIGGGGGFGVSATASASANGRVSTVARGRASTSASASTRGYPGRSSQDSQGITVHKHVYVHIAPPDAEEERQPKARVIVPPPQKHYKIIFVKAPTPPTPTLPDIPPIQQDEEKTLVYVLVKRPEEQPEIQIPTAPPTEPSKPEVYFIKYKAQKEESDVHGGAGQDFSQIDDDTVEVGARRGGDASRSGASFAAGQLATAQGNIAQQGGASRGAFSAATAFSSSSSSGSFRSAAVPSSQYGAPEARGPY